MRSLKQLGRYVRVMGSAISVFGFLEYARIDLNLTLCMNAEHIDPSALMNALKTDLVLPGLRPIYLQRCFIHKYFVPLLGFTLAETVYRVWLEHRSSPFDLQFFEDLVKLKFGVLHNVTVLLTDFHS